MEQNIRPIKINNEIKQEDNKEKKKLDNSSLIRLDSPVTDNESNIILFKYNNIQAELNKTNIEKDNNKSMNINTNANINTISHDKEIMEDSIIYFNQKLKKNNIEYHKCLYISIVLYCIDVIIYYLDKHILHSNCNLYSILIMLILSIIQLYAFKHNFETISKEIYILTQRIIYIYYLAILFFFINLFYIFFFKLIFSSEDNNNVYQKKILHFMGFSLIIFSYIIINLIIPIIVLNKLIVIKKSIKNLSAAKGEVYETVTIKDSQFNSIIN